MGIDPSLIVKTILALLEVSKSRRGSNPQADPSAVDSAVHHHLTFVENWSSAIPHPALPGERPLHRTFVHLPLAILPRKRRHRAYSTEPPPTYESAPPLKSDALIASPGHHLLLGDPGAGKSTVVKQLCQHLLHNEPLAAADCCSFPLVLRCRELDQRSSLYRWLFSALGIGQPPRQLAMQRRLATQVLDECKAFLFIDGLDEAPSEARDQVLQQFGELVHSVSDARLMLTCRSGGFEEIVEGANIFELAPLDAQLIRELVSKWIPDHDQAVVFLEQLQHSPYCDTAVRPLTLVHLCALYQAYGAIPDRPRSIYRRVVFLLLEDWDRANLIRRKSAYARFGPERKAEFLSALSYAATMNGYKGRFSRRDLGELYRGICAEFDLPRDEARQVATEIESHSGLLVQCGHDEYEIAHLSLQEYLCADYLVRGQLNQIPYPLIVKLGDEIAVATGLASNASDFVFGLVCRCPGIREKEDRTFWSRFVRRLKLERPDFCADSKLGGAILCLLDWFRAAELFDETMDLWESFLCEGPIQESLRRAAQLCSAQKLDRKWTEVTVLPAASVLQGMRNTRFLVPTRLLPRQVFRRRPSNSRAED